MKLSVTVITLNEEKNIKRCISSIKGIADEIIVVDSGSTDKTVKIAKKFGAKIYAKKFDNYASQKNFAARKATGEWIFSIDADETITPDLAKEIKGVIKSDEHEGYTIPRRNIIFGEFIKHTRWNPELDRHVWLWERGKGRWVGEVHEEVEVNGSVGELKHPKVHRHYETVNEFFEMMNRYSELEAEKLIKGGVNFSYFKFIYDPIHEFFVRYFYRLGFLDGWRGFVLSYLMAIYKMAAWIKVWERKRVIKLSSD